MAPVTAIKLSVADKNSNRADKDCLPIRILLAQSQTILRVGLRSLLEREPDLQVVDSGDRCHNLEIVEANPKACWVGGNLEIVAPVPEIKLCVADMNPNRADKDNLPIRILIAQSQTILRVGLRQLLEREPDLHVVAEASDGPQAIYQAAEVNPDILLIDQEILEYACAAILEHAAGQEGFPRIFVLCSSNGKGMAEKALEMGAWGFAYKESTTRFLIDGIRSVMAGNRWFCNRSSDSSDSTRDGSQENAPRGVGEKSFGLTKREMEIISVVLAGHSNREIARKLHISEDTVKHHLTNIFDKIGVYHRLELALFAIHHGLNKAT